MKLQIVPKLANDLIAQAEDVPDTVKNRTELFPRNNDTGSNTLCTTTATRKGICMVTATCERDEATKFDSTTNGNICGPTNGHFNTVSAQFAILD
ncbi:UNVERIFIED_CONTAM: hypothetical protein HDU68_009569 [Siphonaria sp. JEL0065]|nr:hypothetical protein HDU68_009569 [Siphonaria sp. JEL0065]